MAIKLPVRLHIFLLEILDKLTKEVLFKETVFTIDCAYEEDFYSDIYNETNVRTNVVDTIYSKKSHSFLRKVALRNWYIDTCLADTKMFDNLQVCLQHMETTKLEPGPLMGKTLLFNLTT